MTGDAAAATHAARQRTRRGREPRRREILRLVRDRELRAGEIAERFGDVSRPAISQHLLVLREPRWSASAATGRARLYRACPEGLGDLRDFIELFWDERLETLRREAEKEREEQAT